MKSLYKVKINFILCILVLATGIFAQVKYPLILQNLIDFTAMRDLSNLKKYLFFLILFTMIIILCQSLYSIFKVKYLNSITYKMRSDIVQGILNKKSSDLTSQKQSEYISIFHNDIQMVCDDYYETILNIVSSSLTIILSITALASLNFTITLIILCNFILLALNPLIFRKLLQNCKTDMSFSLKKYNTKLTDFMSGIQIIKSYLSEKEFKEKVNAASRNVNSSKYKYEKTQMYANLFSMIIGYSNDFIVIGVGIYCIFTGKMTVGSLLAVLQISNLIANPITTLSYHFNTLNSIKPIKTMLSNLAKEEKNSYEHLSDMDKINKIKVADVSLSLSETTLIKNINFSFEHGKKYLIIGKNGSGKSTFLKLISRIYTDYNGSIFIDDVNLKNVSFESYYKNISVVFQDSYVFSGSIKDNITLYKNYDLSEYHSIIQTLNLNEIVDKSSDDSIHHLSGGEKQKIALARALIRNPKILILDEALSAMDVENRNSTERFLLSQPITIISVAHQFSDELLNFYDEILIMNDGSLVEHNSYENLSAEIKNWIHAFPQK